VLHDPDDNLLFVGATSFNTPVFANNVVVEADLRISVGWIYPHIRAGYGGGAKTIFPATAIAFFASMCQTRCTSSLPQGILLTRIFISL
jgi:nickel-dependent lactate racemase